MVKVLAEQIKRLDIKSLDGLWWVMHQSEDPKRLASVVTLYLDESATDDAAPIAVVGGLLLNKEGFESLDEAFPKLLKKHGVPPPLHIKDFRRPQGRLANVSDETKHALFMDLVPLINSAKLYSIAATLTTAQYKKHFEANFRKKGMGLYGVCFMMCAIINQKLAEFNSYDKRIPFLMDAGNPYADHVRGAHAALQQASSKYKSIGSLAFDDDKLWSPLQAADVIAWASRVREQTGQFTNGYEPLAGLFDDAHEQPCLPESAYDDLATAIQVLRDTEKDFPL